LRLHSQPVLPTPAGSATHEESAEPMQDNPTAQPDSSSRWRASWPAALPILCAAHCLLAPLLVLFAPVVAPTRAVEVALLVLTAALTVFFLRQGVRSHGRPAVWLPALVGLTAWAAAHFALRGTAETLVEMGGALLLAVGLVWNAWLRHASQCEECGHTTHGSLAGSTEAIGTEEFSTS
jgi:hypothetical protein